VSHVNNPQFIIAVHMAFNVCFCIKWKFRKSCYKANKLFMF